MTTQNKAALPAQGFGTLGKTAQKIQADNTKKLITMPPPSTNMLLALQKRIGFTLIIQTDNREKK